MMTVFDMKMNRALSNLTLHTDEITTVDINSAENTLVAGFRDGIIKIFNIEKNFEVRESYSAFSTSGNKKGGVSQVRIHPTNGALFAASTIGNLKLFRPKV
jgi:WD40 repeat protein